MPKPVIGSNPLTRHQAAVAAVLSPKKKAGRPPAGTGGVKVSVDYQRMSLRLPAESKAVLDALGRLHGKSQSEIVVDGVAVLEKGLSAADKATLRRLKK